MAGAGSDNPRAASVEMTKITRPSAFSELVAPATMIAAAVAVLGLVLVGPSSATAFSVFAVVLLTLTAFAASRWPRATLVVAALTTLLDPVVAPRLAPPGVTLDVIGISEPLLAAAGIVVFVRTARRGGLRAALGDPTAPLVVAFVGLASLSAVLNGTPPVVAAFGILMTIDAIAAFFLWRMLPQSLGAAALATAGIVAGAVAVSLVGILQVLLDPALLGFVSRVGYGGIGPITSILGNPNMVAMVLAFAAPFPIFGAVRLPTRRHRWLAVAAAFIILLGLALTFSRGGWAAAAAGLGIGTLLLDRRALLLAIALSALAWGTVLFMPVGLLIAESQPLVPTASQALSADAPSPSPRPDPSPSADPTVDAFKGMSSEEVRLLLVRDGLRIIDHHRLLGVGPGRYGGAAAAIFPSPVYAEYDTTIGHLRTVHNFWLHLTGEVGALGVAVFLGIIVALAIRFVLSARTATGLRFVVLGGCATAVVVAIVHNLTEMSLEGNVPGILMWLTLGLGSTLAHGSLRPAQHRQRDD